ncbi:MAG: LOG family protein [Gammaproteobacteria bacterium]
MPSDEPKSGAVDPEAPARVRQIMASPGYRQADEDVEFLALDENRGVRLQLDYQKAELLLRQHGIQATVVAFGGTRIMEPRAARLKLDEVRARQARAPGDDHLEAAVARARRVLDNSRFYEVARLLGRLVGNSGGGPSDSRLVMMTGGGPGLMEAANRGAHEVGAKTVGLNITLPREQYPNPYVTPELCLRFHYFALRKLHFLLRTRALVAFPGGYGTLDELFETLNLVQTRKIRPLPVILVGEAWWRRAVDVDFLAGEGVIDEEDRDLFWYAEDAEEIWRGILEWHERSGSPLFPPG